MLSFFPEMYPDEILYSVFSRYHRYSGNQTMKMTYSELTGGKQNFSCNPVILPRNLEYLVTQIQGYGISFNDLLYERTFFPFITLFRSDDLMELAKTWAFSSSINSSQLVSCEQDYFHTYSGPLKYCPSCLEEQYSVYGEAYWHRLHQIPGVLVCTKHKMLLQKSRVLPRAVTDGFHCLDKALISSIQNVDYLNTDDMKIAVQLAHGIQWISDNFEKAHRLWNEYSSCFREVYFHLLIKKGFATKHRVILVSQFTRDIVRYFGNVLSFFNLSFYNNNSHSWPIRIFLSGGREIEPLRHFLMMQYLSGSIQDFFDQLKHLKSNDFKGAPSQNFYFKTAPSLFDKDKEKFRIIWKRNCEKNNREYFCCLDKKTISARSWLYIYDYSWLINNLQTKENARDIRRLNEENADISRRTGIQHLPFSLCNRLFCRYGFIWGSSKAIYKRIAIKSLPEAQTAYKKWKSIHRYRTSKKQVSASSAIFEYSIVSAMMDTIEKAPAIFGC